MPTKIALRSLILAKRKAIPAVRRRAKSKKILARLLKDPSFCEAEHIAFYCGIASEVATRPFLSAILKSKKVYLPRTAPGRKLMTLRRVRSLSKDLVKGPYGIMEPRLSCVARPACRMDLIIVPGVAFDRCGGRLGRGAGYYDRLLKKARKVVTMGLCFREQLVRKVPMSRLDMCVDRVIAD